MALAPGSSGWRSRHPQLSELQPAFTGSVGQSLDFTVEQESTAVEDNLFDTGFLGPFRDRRANLGGGFDVVFAQNAQILLKRAGRSDRYAVQIVDDLNRDVLVRPMDGQTRAAIAFGPQFVPDAQAALLEQLLLFQCHFMRPLLLLAFLAEDKFALIADTFTLIGLGLAPFANIGRNLSDKLLVNSFHNH